MIKYKEKTYNNFENQISRALAGRDGGALALAAHRRRHRRQRRQEAVHVRVREG